MSDNQSNELSVETSSPLRRVATADPTSLIVGRASQPMGFMDTINARVPGFEEVTEQPDWGGHGFAGRKSDVRVIRFDRQPAAAESETETTPS